MNGENQPAFLLHTRPYRDSSLILECITANYGRVSGIKKGVRGTGKSAKSQRSILQPFAPLEVSWIGRGQLKTFTHCEAVAAPLALQGKTLFSGFYINELFMRLLEPQDGSEVWYQLYYRTLQQLAVQEQPVDVLLRQFEFKLLELLGYGIDLSSAQDGPVMADCQYRFIPDQGFLEVGSGQAAEQLHAAQPVSEFYLGAELLAIAASQYDESVRRAAKRLCRQALAPLLGNKPLKSRDLFK